MNFRALKQLDRRLSVGRSHNQWKGATRRQRPGLPSTPEEVDEYFEGGFLSLDGMKETEDSTDTDSNSVLEELPVYCFQHARQTLEQKGTFIGGLLVEFDGEWHRLALHAPFSYTCCPELM